MSLVRPSMVPGGAGAGCVLLFIFGRGKLNGNVAEGVTLGTGVVPVAGVAGGNKPACLNIFISAMGSVGAFAGF